MTEKYTLNFGKHKGEELADVPASYLLWLADQDWVGFEVRDYVEKNKKYLEDEVKNRNE